MTLTGNAAHARRCAADGCNFWTAHESGICPRCRERGITAVAKPAPAQLSVPELDLLEDDVQIACIETLEMCGWKVYRVGQYNAERTQDAGVSDLIAFKPGIGVAFVEVKRSRGGKQSDAQREFQMACESAGEPYILTNDAHHLFAALVELTGGTNG